MVTRSHESYQEAQRAMLEFFTVKDSWRLSTDLIN